MKFLSLIRFIILFVFANALTLSVHAKDYTIPELQIEVSVNLDGTITITEHRTYVFDGSYSWANYRIPKLGFSAIRNIQVSENGSYLTNLNSEEPETFLIEESDDAYNLKWFFNAKDEERVFTLTYTLEEALIIGPEWSELTWIYVASGRERSTEQLQILVELPEEVTTSNLQSWVRKPIWDMQSSKMENGFRFIGTNINRSQSVEIRTVFPTSVFQENLISISDANFNLELARQEEVAYREQKIQQAEDEERRANLAWELIIAIAGISIISFIFFYRKYGSRHRISLSSNNSIMLPGREKPATIGWLLSGRTIGYNLIMATLLDLARRDYFIIKEHEADDDKDKSWLKSDEPYFTVSGTQKTPEPNMPGYEENLINFVSKRIKSEGEKFDEIFNFQKSEASKWFYKWKDELKTHCKSQQWIDPESYKGLYWNLGVQSFLITAGILGAFFLHPLVLISLAVSFCTALLSLAIIRRTPKGQEIYQRWKNYMKAIQKAKDYSISEEHLGLHFIYAIALGINKTHIETMFEQNPGALAAIYWIAILPGSTNSPAAIATSFSNLAATGTISATGGSFAGGASAGVAGGGASGGAG